MEIDEPSPEIIAAVQGAVRWFDEAKLTGIREIRKDAKDMPRGYDKGPCTYDVCKIFRIFVPLPPCLHWGLIYSIDFTQPPLLHLLLRYPLPPPSADVIWAYPLK